AREVIKALNTYTEISPSGRGVRLFLYGKLPARGRKRGKFECYESGRYVTVTGQHLQGTPRTIEHRQEQLAPVHKRIFGEPPTKSKDHQSGGCPANADDAEIIRRAGESKVGGKFKQLWNGDASGYASPSEADLALCSYL